MNIKKILPAIFLAVIFVMGSFLYIEPADSAEAQFGPNNSFKPGWPLPHSIQLEMLKGLTLRITKITKWFDSETGATVEAEGNANPPAKLCNENNQGATEKTECEQCACTDDRTLCCDAEIEWECREDGWAMKDAKAIGGSCRYYPTGNGGGSAAEVEAASPS